MYLFAQIMFNVFAVCVIAVEVVLTHYVHVKTAEQRTIIQQYGDWYTGR